MNPRDSTLKRPVNILLVEDNPTDALLTQEALKNSKMKNKVVVARDGAEALEILRKKGAHSNVAHPDLVLLDLNLPKVDGYEVLSQVKNDPVLKKIPVVVFSSSKGQTDVLKCYSLGANSYVTKPVELDRFNETLEDIQEFFFFTSRTPQT